MRQLVSEHGAAFAFVPVPPVVGQKHDRPPPPAVAGEGRSGTSRRSTGQRYPIARRSSSSRPIMSASSIAYPRRLQSKRRRTRRLSGRRRVRSQQGGLRECASPRAGSRSRPAALPSSVPAGCHTHRSRQRDDRRPPISREPAPRNGAIRSVFGPRAPGSTSLIARVAERTLSRRSTTSSVLGRDGHDIQRHDQPKAETREPPAAGPRRDPERVQGQCWHEEQRHLHGEPHKRPSRGC